MLDLASSTSSSASRPQASPGLDALVVVVDRDRQGLLGGVLADDVVSRNSKISRGLGSSSRPQQLLVSASSSSMISLHRSMHSSQM
jgi:hypothetical protein